MMNTKLSYTINEVSEATGLGRTKIYELIGNGSLKSFKIGHRRLVRAVDLEALISTADSSS